MAAKPVLHTPVSHRGGIIKIYAGTVMCPAWSVILYGKDETAEMKILDYIMMVIFVTDFVFALLVLSLLIASFFLVF